MDFANDVFVMTADKLIRVNGVTYRIENFPVNPNIHAIHWWGREGEIEYVDKSRYANEKFTADRYDEVFGTYIAAWTAQKAIEDEKQREAEELYNSEEQRFFRLRQRRDARLSACDYVMVADYYAKLTDEQKTAWTAYRQALRDLTSQEGAPWDGGDDGKTVPWPVAPDKKN